ncbi:MAG: transposase [Gammaproteobacteria bacterium]|nr:transposase [Gammaproteobacteria bacterium]
MSRPIRIEFENAYYHVMNRGRGRQAIFHGEEYYRAFLSTLDEAHTRFGLQIHAYCLMRNHYHLLVKTPEGNLQRAMRHVGSVYTQRYNRLKKTDGSLFRGRYKAILVNHDEYLLHLSKYIHKNPLEAHMVSRLEDHSWSSYPSYIGLHKSASWLYRHEVYAQLQTKRQLAKKYQAYVNEDGMPKMLEDFYSHERLGPILGDADFIDDIRDKLDEVYEEASHTEKQQFRPSISMIVGTVSDYCGLSHSEIYRPKKGRGVKNQPRKIAMYLAQHIGGYRLTEIAEAFGLKHYGGVSNAIHMIKQEMEADVKISRSVNDIINRFDP